MRMRQAVLAGGFAFGLMSGAATAAPLPISYDVDFTVSALWNPSVKAHVTGYVNTDGKIGILSRADITGFSISSGGSTINQNTDLFVGGIALSATKTQLLWTPDAGKYDQFDFGNYKGLIVVLNDRGIFAQSNAPLSTTVINPFKTGDTFLFGSVSAVPLPASAPMFGAALLGLAGIGYAAKRKMAAVSA